MLEDDNSVEQILDHAWEANAAETQLKILESSRDKVSSIAWSMERSSST